jgi:hypothetical protein
LHFFSFPVFYYIIYYISFVNILVEYNFLDSFQTVCLFNPCLGIICDCVFS